MKNHSDVPAREDSGSGFTFGLRGRDRLIVLVLSVATPLVLVGAGGAITADAIPGWYAELPKPTWKPPSWLIGPVWTVLYLTMGVAAWLVWRRGAVPGASTALKSQVRAALVVYGVQLVLNASWSPMFFGLKRVDFALVIIVMMLLAIAETIRRFYRLDRLAALLLAPYLGWVAFATVLNASIWLLNRG